MHSIWRDETKKTHDLSLYELRPAKILYVIFDSEHRNFRSYRENAECLMFKQKSTSTSISIIFYSSIRFSWNDSVSNTIFIPHESLCELSRKAIRFLVLHGSIMCPSKILYGFQTKFNKCYFRTIKLLLKLNSFHKHVFLFSDASSLDLWFSGK